MRRRTFIQAVAASATVPAAEGVTVTPLVSDDVLAGRGRHWGRCAGTERWQSLC